MSQAHVIETDDQHACRLAKDRERKSQAHAIETKDQRAYRLAKDREYTSQGRAMENDDQRASRRERDRVGLYTSQARLYETEQKRKDIQMCIRDRHYCASLTFCKNYFTFFVKSLTI